MEKGGKGEQSLQHWLKDIHLPECVSTQLEELGASRVTHLLDLDEEDVASLKLNTLEMKRFNRGLKILYRGGIPGKVTPQAKQVAEEDDGTATKEGTARKDTEGAEKGGG